MSARTRTIWTFIVTTAALFIAQLDTLVVTTALPAIRTHLEITLRFARQVEEFDLPDEAEPAPIFRA